jgi:hypothetical protein
MIDRSDWEEPLAALRADGDQEIPKHKQQLIAMLFVFGDLLITRRRRNAGANGSHDVRIIVPPLVVSNSPFSFSPVFLLVREDSGQRTQLDTRLRRLV